jgi:hypothetical protein
VERCLKTIAAFLTPEDAEVAKIALDDEGIESFLEGAATVGMLWYAGNALGGVKLQVAEADVQRAKEILAQTDVSSTEAWTCQHCGEKVPLGFNVCWSCESPVEDSSRAPGAAPSPVPGVEETEATDEGDAMAWRAAAAAVIGVFLCPPLLTFYSISILLKLSFLDHPLSRKGTRNFYVAICVDLAVGLVCGWWVRFICGL